MDNNDPWNTLNQDCIYSIQAHPCIKRLNSRILKHRIVKSFIQNKSLFGSFFREIVKLLLLAIISVFSLFIYVFSQKTTYSEDNESQSDFEGYKYGEEGLGYYFGHYRIDNDDND